MFKRVPFVIKMKKIHYKRSGEFEHSAKFWRFAIIFHPFHAYLCKLKNQNFF